MTVPHIRVRERPAMWGAEERQVRPRWTKKISMTTTQIKVATGSTLLALSFMIRIDYARDVQF